MKQRGLSFSKKSIKQPGPSQKKKSSHCFISRLPLPIFGLYQTTWSGYSKKSLYQTTSTIFFSNSRSLERQGLFIETQQTGENADNSYAKFLCNLRIQTLTRQAKTICVLANSQMTKFQATNFVTILSSFNIFMRKCISISGKFSPS